MNENLKHCPFCGGEAAISEDKFEGEKVFSVSCKNCFTSTAGSKNPQKVIDDWNKRTEKILLPCPFCGNKADIFEIEDNGEKLLAVGCEVCGIITIASEDENEVIDAWNKRTT